MKKEELALKDKILKSAIQTILVLLLCVIFVFTLLISPFIIMSLTAYLSPNPPKPEIKSAEFPIKLVYENGEKIRTIEDVYICEYAGWDIHDGNLNKYRKWNGALSKNENSDSFILLSNEKITIEYVLDNPGYYMGDNNYIKKLSNFKVTKYPKDGDIITYTYISIDDINDYGIDIIEYNFPEPIENRFEPNGFESVMPYVTFVIGGVIFIGSILFFVVVLRKMKQIKRNAENNSML